jgi:signal transduction histidine kinase
MLPVVIAMIAAAAAASWALIRWRAHAVVMFVLPSLASWLAAHGMVWLLAASRGRELAGVLARPVVERGLMAAPLVGALLGAGVWMLHRSRQRELVAFGREASLRAEREALQRQHMQARLQLLQAQVEPHFLYNTLANLRQLMRRDTQQALEMLDHLIRYFKLTLPSLQVERLPLGDELDLVRAYLDLMGHRIGRPLHLSVNVPAELRGVPMPPGALLCLVENAVKHGQPLGDGPLDLHIAAARGDDGRVRVSVRDHGAGPPDRPRPGASGLANLRERLRLQWGDGRASVALHRADPGCEAVLEFPSERCDAPSPDR